MSRRGIVLAALSLALAWPTAQAQTRPRYIALIADELTKSGEAMASTTAEPEATWRKLRGAAVINGAALTRSSVARVLGDKGLRGRRVVLLLRGTTTAGPSAPPAWLVHSQLKGADALLDRDRLITAADLRGWLARSGAARVAVFVEGSDGVDALCTELSAALVGPQKIDAWCQRSNSAAAQSMGAWLARLPADRTRVAALFGGQFDGHFSPR